MTTLTTKTNQQTPEEIKAAFVEAIKDAFAFRAALFARGNWSREEMVAANDRILYAQQQAKAHAK